MDFIQTRSSARKKSWRNKRASNSNLFSISLGDSCSLKGLQLLAACTAVEVRFADQWLSIPSIGEFPINGKSFLSQRARREPHFLATKQGSPATWDILL